jgi:hypothetical protein
VQLQASLGPYVAQGPFSALDRCEFDNAVYRSLWGKFQTHPEFLYLKDNGTVVL